MKKCCPSGTPPASSMPQEVPPECFTVQEIQVQQQDKKQLQMIVTDRKNRR
jgi:hypothetical protein